MTLAHLTIRKPPCKCHPACGTVRVWHPNGGACKGRACTTAHRVVLTCNGGGVLLPFGAPHFACHPWVGRWAGKRVKGGGAFPWAFVLCPDRDTLLDVSARYLWVQGAQWFNGSMVQRRPRQPSRDRSQEGSKESMDCQSKAKTKLRSTTDTEAILIAEGPQLIVNKCTQVRHYESYGRS